MVQDAKEVAANTQNVAAGNQWRNSNKHVSYQIKPLFLQFVSEINMKLALMRM